MPKSISNHSKSRRSHTSLSLSGHSVLSADQDSMRILQAVHVVKHIDDQVLVLFYNGHGICREGSI